jgi:hypothetical protein
MGGQPTQGDEKHGLVFFGYPQNCHPDRSEAKWRDLLFSGTLMDSCPYGSSPKWQY